MVLGGSGVIWGIVALWRSSACKNVKMLEFLVIMLKYYYLCR